MSEGSRKQAPSVEFHEGHRGAVYGYLRRQIHDAEAVEDLTQETLFKGFRCQGRLRDRQAMVGWLLRIARHSALDWMRRQSSLADRSNRYEEEPRDCPLRGPQSRFLQEQDRQQWSRQLQEALAKLTARERALVVAHYYVGMSCRDIAGRLAITPANVKIRLHRARQRLRRTLVAELRPGGQEGATADGISYGDPSGTPLPDALRRSS
jgi:RNA polymerase sigma-70 factor (ECF subfamily)